MKIRIHGECNEITNTTCKVFNKRYPHLPLMCMYNNLIFDKEGGLKNYFLHFSTLIFYFQIPE